MALTKATYSMISGAVFNVLDFGASPSANAATNTTAFLAAIAAVQAADGGSIYVPTGSYLVQKDLLRFMAMARQHLKSHARMQQLALC